MYSSKCENSIKTFSVHANVDATEGNRLRLILRRPFKEETSLKSGMKVDRRGSSIYSMERKDTRRD
jgi:hypothetical protein